MTVSVLWLLLAMPWVHLQCVIVVFPGHTHLLFQIPFACEDEKPGVVRYLNSAKLNLAKLLRLKILTKVRNN